jgi:4'-phosphopantetheinyl transferase
VDIERIREIPEMLAIAKRYFLDSEYREIVMLSSAFQIKAFFDMWTATEARLKATGEGFLDLPKRDGSPVADSCDRAVTETESSQWNLHRFARDGYSVALVTTGQPLGSALYEFNSAFKFKGS